MCACEGGQRALYAQCERTGLSLEGDKLCVCVCVCVCVCACMRVCGHGPQTPALDLGGPKSEILGQLVSHVVGSEVAAP